MANAVQEALDAIRELGSPAELRAAAGPGALAPAAPANAHIHLPPNFSAFETVPQAVGLAADQGVRVLGVSNYYDFTVYGEYAALARERGIFPLFGLEILLMKHDLREQGVKVNDPGNPGKTYLCGKAITRFGDMTPRAGELLADIRRNDSARMVEMTDRLRAVFAERGLDVGVTADDVVSMIEERHGSPRGTIYLQERHIAQAFSNAALAMTSEAGRAGQLAPVLGVDPADVPTNEVKLQGDIRSALMKAGKPAFVEETFGSFEDSVALILELGGIPSYPTLADGVSPVTDFEATPEKLVESIRSMGLCAAELIPIRNTPEVLGAYVKTLRAAGLLVTAGTEHNTLDLLAIEPTCVGGTPVPDDIKDIFWEGACVCAAHQFLTLHGETGFVDAQGKPNPVYASDDERIREMAKLGAAVIQRYIDKAS